MPGQRSTLVSIVRHEKEPMVELMRAAVYHRYGGPEVLEIERIPRPRLRPGKLIVRVLATSVNGGELLARAGAVRFMAALQPGFPKRVGLDFVGVVDEVGEGVASSQVGEIVWGQSRLDAAAEYIEASTDRVFRIPAGLDPIRAAALPAVGTTAITALERHARLRPGERVLIRGGAGGVGSAAVQLAHAAGAHVTALASQRVAVQVEALGADVVHDYRATTAEQLGTFDVIFDTTFTDLESFRRRLAPGGCVVTVTFDHHHIPRSLAYIALSARHHHQRVRFFSGNPKQELFQRLTTLVEQGHIAPVVDTVYPLEDIAAAHAHAERGGTVGKIIVAVTDPTRKEQTS
jgi:NADPH:quinone reductase-like Zn-dependent oxidoreductase